MAVEAAATALAARRRTNADVARIKAQLEAMQKAIDGGDPGVDEDVAFHRAIVQATGNPFRDISDFLDRRVRNFIRKARSNTARLRGLSQVVQKEHEVIFDAIVKGDANATRNACSVRLRLFAWRRELSGL